VLTGSTGSRARPTKVRTVALDLARTYAVVIGMQVLDFYMIDEKKQNDDGRRTQTPTHSALSLFMTYRSDLLDCPSWRLIRTCHNKSRRVGFHPALLVASLWLALPVSSLPSKSPLSFHSAAFRLSFSSTRPTRMAILESPSAERNKEPIFGILTAKVLPLLLSCSDAATGSSLKVLEVAAGGGVHTDYFTSKLASDPSIRNLEWYPTDPDLESRESIQARIEARRSSAKQKSETIQNPLCLTLDANGVVESDTDAALSSTSVDLLICINMIHISPWSATVGLMKLANRTMRPGGVLYCYGPYKVGGTAVESNL
jgi:hypothetical protein